MHAGGEVSFCFQAKFAKNEAGGYAFALRMPFVRVKQGCDRLPMLTSCDVVRKLPNGGYLGGKVSHLILGDKKSQKRLRVALVALMWRLGCGAVLSQFRCNKKHPFCIF